MIAIRSICVVSSLLLAACTLRQPVHEIPVEAPPSPKATRSQIVNKAPLTTTAKAKKEEIVVVQTPVKEKISRLFRSKKEVPLPEASKEITPVTAKKQSTSSFAASKISTWNISGAMAARAKNKGWSAGVNWVQQGPGHYQIRLSGPLGSGAVMISKSGGVVTLHDGPKTVSSGSAESLLKQQTGISLPVANLYYWARGIPAPGSVQAEKRDQAGRLVLLRQAGYTIQYLQYTAAGNVALPSSIRLQGNGVFIKFIIKNWRV